MEFFPGAHCRVVLLRFHQLVVCISLELVHGPGAGPFVLVAVRKNFINGTDPVGEVMFRSFES